MLPVLLFNLKKKLKCVAEKSYQSKSKQKLKLMWKLSLDEKKNSSKTSPYS